MFGNERKELNPETAIFIQTARYAMTRHAKGGKEPDTVCYTAVFKNGRPDLRRLSGGIPEAAAKIVCFENKIFTLAAADRRERYGLSDYAIARFCLKRNGRTADYRSIYLLDSGAAIRLISVHSEAECRAILELFRKQAAERLGGETSVAERVCGRAEFTRVMTGILAAAAHEL